MDLERERERVAKGRQSERERERVRGVKGARAGGSALHATAGTNNC